MKDILEVIFGWFAVPRSKQESTAAMENRAVESQRRLEALDARGGIQYLP